MISFTRITQWVNSVPPYIRKLHFTYELIRTWSKYRWSIHRTSSKCHWRIYRTSRKCRGTLRVVHKAERSSPTLYQNISALLMKQMNVELCRWLYRFRNNFYTLIYRSGKNWILWPIHEAQFNFFIDEILFCTPLGYGRNHIFQKMLGSKVHFRIKLSNLWYHHRQYFWTNMHIVLTSHFALYTTVLYLFGKRLSISPVMTWN